MERSSDQALLEAWAEGSDDAGAKLFERHFDPVFRFFSSKIANESLVDDLVQQTFLACLEHRERLPSVRSFRVYALGVARRRLMRFFRSSYRERRAMDAYGPCADELIASPSSVLSLRSEVQVIATAIRRIPIELQITLELHYHESLRVHEIAQVLEVPAGTVKSRLSRARAALAAAVEQLRAEPDLLRRTTARLEFWTGKLGPSSPKE